jgi:hypothetical protein
MNVIMLADYFYYSVVKDTKKVVSIATIAAKAVRIQFTLITIAVTIENVITLKLATDGIREFI